MQTTQLSNNLQKRIVVTGAAAGLGRDLALAFAMRGMLVAAVDLNKEGLNATVEMGRENGLTVVPIVADLAADGASVHVVHQVVNHIGGVDALINCAAVALIEPFLQMTEEAWSRTLAVNVKAVAALTVAVGNWMIDHGVHGRIINITSAASRMALPNYAAYAASKAAVDSFTRAAAVQLARSGIAVNSVSPGMMDTEMQRATEAKLAVLEGRKDLDAFLAERTNRVPIGRRAEIREVAECILWLALDAPAYVVCERLNVTGGLDKD